MTDDVHRQSEENWFANTLPVLRGPIKDFEMQKRDEVLESTWRTYEPTLREFTEFLSEEAVQELAEIEPLHFQRFAAELRQRGLEATTREKKVKQLQTLFRVLSAFYEEVPREWVMSHGPIEQAKPAVSKEEASRVDEAVPVDLAERIVERQRFVNPAGRDTAVLGVLLDTGARVSDLRSLDVDDYDVDSNRLHFVNRPETGTRLKNGSKSERYAHLSPATCNSISNYLENPCRYEVEEESGRRPLFTNGGNGNPRGRITAKTIKGIAYGYTRPCEIDGTCPAGKDPETCEWAGNRSKAISCPESYRPHAWRGTAVTRLYYEVGMRKDHISDMCDMSLSTMEKHYLGQPRDEDLDDQYDQYYGSSDS